ncbi:MAG TPA: hypothetical protein ENJ88_05660 [Phaeodactylibacter sp.]|nr:hypothetical protein [Phaeodactylibacter sp.]
MQALLPVPKLRKLPAPRKPAIKKAAQKLKKPLALRRAAKKPAAKKATKKPAAKKVRKAKKPANKPLL